MIDFIPLAVLLLLLLLGMPIGIALGLAGVLGIGLVGGMDTLMGMAGLVPYSSSASFLLSSIPLFMLMAEFTTRGGLARDLFDTAYKWLGHWPGGLGLAAIAASSAMGAMSGSSTASASAIAGASIKEMIRYKYRPSLAAGSIAAGGTLAIMIPPSIPMVVYGVQTQTSIGQLFIAGIIPGLITALAYMLVIVIWVKIIPGSALTRETAFPLRERLRSLYLIWPVLVLVLVVIGGMYAGWFTATEAGAVGAAGALILSLVLRRFSIREIWPALARAGSTTAMLMTIVFGAHFFAYYVTLAGITSAIQSFVDATSLGPLGTILLIVIPLYIVLGMFMDNIPILLLTLPVLFPLAMKLGYDPIWFGVLIIALGEIGLLTPPVGLNAFVVSNVTRIPLEQVFKGVMPFVLANLVCIALLIAFPGLATFLPNLIR